MNNFRQKTNLDWTSDDYYNRYIETKQFYNFPARIYKRHEYTEIKDRLDRYAEHFNYILKKLQPEDKQEFISYYKSDLTSLKNKQTQLEFIKLINDFIQDIEVTPQQAESVKPDAVKKELHARIFKDNAFEIWQSMFEKFNIDKCKRTDIDFMFEVMKYNNQIHTNIGYKDIEVWINEVYEIVFDRIKFTDTKSKANEKRLIIYNEIKENQK